MSWQDESPPHWISQASWLGQYIVAFLHAEALAQLMMHVFETQPPVQTEGHEPLSTGSAGQLFPVSAPASGVPPVHRPALHVAPAVQVNVDPQPPQLLASVAKSTQPPLQIMGATDGQPETHEYAPADPAHTGVLPLHAVPQLPQLAPVVYWTQTPPHRDVRPGQPSLPESAASSGLDCSDWRSASELALPSLPPPSSATLPSGTPPSEALPSIGPSS